jgi:dihydroxyacetone kinase-like predicted kinase
MNPSIDEMLRAVDESAAQDVILLPNNGNVLLAAQQVRGLSSKNVTVLPTRSIVQGLAAVSAFNGELPLAEAVERMQRSIDRAITVEIARADKDAVVDGVTVEEGSYVGLVNARLTDSRSDLVDVVSAALQRVVTAKSELITVFAGLDLSDVEAANIAATLENRLSNCDIEIISGQQPHYLLIISVE